MDASNELTAAIGRGFTGIRFRSGGLAATPTNCRSRKPLRAEARCLPDVLHRTDADTIAAIERLCRQRMGGPEIAKQLNIPRSTVAAILRRLSFGKLIARDAKPPAVCYERDNSGDPTCRHQ